MKKLFFVAGMMASLLFGGCQLQSEPQIYALNEPAAAGGFVHTVTFAEKLELIPSTDSSYFGLQDLAPEPGFVWVHLKGLITNQGANQYVFSDSDFGLVDGNENLYAASNKTSAYLEESRSAHYLLVLPSNSAEWEIYFEVPVTAEPLQYYGNDPQFVVGEEADDFDSIRVDLGF